MSKFTTDGETVTVVEDDGTQTVLPVVDDFTDDLPMNGQTIAALTESGRLVIVAVTGHHDLTGEQA